VTDAAERVGSQVEADVEAVRERLCQDGGEVVARLDAAHSQLRRHLDALNGLAARCSHVNTTNLHVYCFELVAWHSGRTSVYDL